MGAHNVEWIIDPDPPIALLCDLLTALSRSGEALGRGLEPLRSDGFVFARSRLTSAG
jgi:hypothetical protein